MLPMDCHTHTSYSPDSDAPLSAMLDRAQAIGLQAYAVTDHIELCRFWPQGYYGTQPRNEEDFFDYAALYEASVAAFCAERERRNTQMQLVCGIELGEPNADFALAESVLKDCRLDFAIASLHELPEQLDFYFLDYQKEDPVKLLDTYFSELLRICEWGKFDVLGHLTYPLRYMSGDAGIVLPMERWREMIAECFKAVIRNRKGIEVNTSGYRQAYGKPFPELEYLQLYRDLGGTQLSLGSDAHRPEDVGAGIAEGAALAKQAGFDKVCYYLRHEPHFIDLI